MSKRPRGKQKMDMEKYEKKSLRKIAQLTRKMNAIVNKKDREWLRLR